MNKRCSAIAMLAALAAAVAVSGFAESRVALVIGNGNYANLPDLRNPVNDATDIAAALKGLGFTVTLATDADRRTMNQAIVAFREALSTDQQSEGVFYFAGHGVQSSKGQNYLMPIDAAVRSETDLEDEAVRAQKLLDSLDEARNRVNLVILDACRDNPLPATARSSASRGLAVVSQAPPETVLLYSTAVGQTASDGVKGSRNSPFTAALLKHLSTPRDITQVIKLVTGEVKATTPEKQTPFVYSNLSRDFVLNRSGAAGPAAPAAAPAAVPASSPAKAPSFGAVTAATGNLTVKLVTAGTLSVGGLSAQVPAGTVPVNDLPAGAQTVTVRYADGKSESYTVTVPSGGTASVSFTYAPTPTPVPAPALAVAAPAQRTPGNSIREEVYVQGGTFQMGSTTGDSDEKPVHAVTVSDFWMMKTEVTQKDYAALTGTNPSNFKGDNLPVEQVSWYDAVAYANSLSASDGLHPAYRISGTSVDWVRSANGWRLPTEAEWEYAARGGRSSRGYTYAGSNEAGAVAWYYGNSGYKTNPVGTKAANELGLYDLSGNVWEWCWDVRGGAYSTASQTDPTGLASGHFRVLRGGNCRVDASYARSAARGFTTPDVQMNTLGFRLVRGK